MSDSIIFRSATEADCDVIAHHRAAMFVDMGSLDPSLEESLRRATSRWLAEAIPRGEYLGWLAAPADRPDRIIAGAGVQVRGVLPFPRRRSDGAGVVAEGRQAIVVNVYTEPAFRRRGIARRLMETVVEWARAVRLESLVLHAAPDGEPLYRSMGFEHTNEMRFTGPLS